MEFLPSVDFGPIDISKALATLQWKPTPMREALKATCDFCDRAWFEYPDERPTGDFASYVTEKIEDVYSSLQRNRKENH